MLCAFLRKVVFWIYVFLTLKKEKKKKIANKSSIIDHKKEKEKKKDPWWWTQKGKEQRKLKDTKNQRALLRESRNSMLDEHSEEPQHQYQSNKVF